MFDVAIVGASKPSFITNIHQSLLRVNPNTGSLHNVEDKSVLTTLLSTSGASSVPQPVGSNIFQGGHWKDLHRMLHISSGEKVLYVGDHMFADIVRSKRTLGWRTVLIIPELEEELEIASRTNAFGRLSLRMRKMQQEVSEELDALWHRQSRGEDVVRELAAMQEKSYALQASVKKINDEYHSKFNAVWGQLLKAGFQDSRFGKQVSDYADLYTSRASNLGFVSPNRSFKPIPDFMSHDRDLMSMEELQLPVESQNNSIVDVLLSDKENEELVGGLPLTV
jgi:5'-nucleotidase